MKSCGALILLAMAACYAGSACTRATAAPRQLPQIARQTPHRIPQLLTQLASGSVEERRAAVKELQDLDTADPETLVYQKEVYVGLADALDDPDSQTADAAALTFAFLGYGSEEREAFQPLLRHSDPKVVARTVKALRILDAYTLDAQPYVFLESSRAVEEAKLIEAIQAAPPENGYWLDKLVAWSEDPREAVRIAAVAALVESSHPAVVPAVVARLSDESADVRLAACGLRNFQSADLIIPALKKAESDPDALVRAKARESRQNLSVPSHPRQLWPKIGQPKFFDPKIGDNIVGRRYLPGVMSVEGNRFFASVSECDGCYNTMVYASRPDLYPGPFYDLVTLPLPEMSTGKGIRLGDAPASVRQVLGPPTRANVVLGDQIDVYEWTAVGYKATYTYERGKLVRILISVQDPRGC